MSDPVTSTYISGLGSANGTANCTPDWTNNSISYTGGSYTITATDSVTNRIDTVLEERISRVEKVIGVTPRQDKLESTYPELHDLGQAMDDAINDYANHLLECQTMEKLKYNNV
jgi:hypothetical protein